MRRVPYAHACAVLWLVLLSLCFARESAAQDTAAAIARGVAWLQAQVRSDGSLASESQSIATPFQARTEAVLTLRTLASVPTALVDGLPAAREDIAEYVARHIVANVAAARDATSLVQQLTAAQNRDAGYGMAAGFASNALDTAWAAFALSQAGYGSTAGAARGYLVAQRQSDGGIGTDDASMRLQLTALAVLALQGGAEAAATTAADAARGFLRSSMSANGAWAGDAYLTALAWLAVGPVTVDPAVRGIVTAYLLGTQGADGSWGADPFVTAIALRALSEVASPSSLVASLGGRVVEGGTGLPLAGASVVAEAPGGLQASATTGIDGRYLIGDLSAATYTLRLSKAGYASATTSVALGAGQQIVLADIALAVAPSTGVVRGIARAAAGNAPLAGVTIAIAGTPSRSALTGADGAYEIVGVPAGAIQVTASKSGFSDVTGTATLASGGVVVFSPSLYATGTSVPTQATVSGQVVNAAGGAPLASVAVKLNGTTRTTTGADGKFSFTTAPGSYTVEYALAGYTSAFQSFVAAAGNAIDAGVVALAAVRTTSKLSGMVSKAGGGALAGATVAIAGGPSVTTGPTGAYVLDNLAGTSFALTITAPGYIGQSYTLQVSTPGDIAQNFTLVPQVQGELQFSALALTPSSVAAGANVDATAQLSNASGAGVAVVIVLQVRDATDTLVATGTPVDALGLGLGVLQLGDAESVNVKAKWNSAQFTSGTYTLVMRAVAAGSISRGDPDGRVLAETRALLSITPDSHIAGTVAADPPVLRAGSAMPVKLSAAIQNSGNAALAAPSFTLAIVNAQTHAEVYSRTVASDDLAPGGLAFLSFPDWTPSVAANYTLTLTTSAAAGTITGSAYVGDSASATYTVDKPLVGPGSQTVKGSIKVTGQDVVTGVITDPLAPLIKTAIQKAVTYNDEAATTWIETNRCSSCHIGNQALVGGELTRRVQPVFNTFQRNVILNNVANNQATNGGLTEGYAGYATTLGTLSLWALNAYHNLQEYKAVLKKAADWAFGLQATDGHWTTDYAAGWFDTNLSLTVLNLDSLAKVQKLLSSETSVTTYATPAFMPSVTAVSRGPLTRDAAGNLYFPQLNAGTVYRLRPDGTVLATWRSLNDPQHAVELTDGQVWLTSAAGLYRLNADGTYVKLNSETMTWLAVAPDGNVYGTRWQDRTIYKLDATGHATAWLTSTSFTWPTAPVFEADGSMLIPDYSTLRVMRVRPDKTVSVLVEMVQGNASPNANPIYLLKDGDHWLLSTTSGIFRFSADWEGQRLTFGRADGMVRLNDGSAVYASYSVAGLKQLVPQATAVATSLANYATGVNRATNWLQGTTLGVTDTVHLAQQLWGLGAAYNFYLPIDPARAATLQARMNTLAAQLRTNQNADGGWGRARGNASDSLVTAQVGFALDYTNPAPSDTAVRRAVTWLLSRQQADGSWISENGIFSTRESATTWVSIWLPVILDRLGGIDTKVTATFAPNVAMSAPTIAPNTVQTLSTGEQRYTWNLPSVTNAGREINFDLTLANLALNETRAASTEAYLSFANTFTSETQTAPIAIPTVTASGFMSLGVVTDRSSYPANSPVAITGAVTNTGVVAQSGRVTYDIVDASDVPADSAPAGSFAALASNASTNVASSWNTGTSAAGAYAVVATLYDSSNRKVASARTGFTIVAGTGGPDPALVSSVTTDKQSYLANDRVAITARLRNQAPNFSYADLRIVETVTDAGGGVVYTSTQPLRELAASAIEDLAFTQMLNGAAPGIYTVTQRVQDASGTVVDTRTTQYTVQSSSTTGSGLSGSIAAAPKELIAGEAITFSGSARNLGNASLDNLALTLAVIDPVSAAIVQQWQYSPTLAQNATHAIAQGWTTSSLVAGTYIVALSASVGGKAINLAQDTFTVLESDSQLRVTQGFDDDPRVLVLIACDAGSPPTCASERASFTFGYLTSQGIQHKLAVGITPFVTGLRSGRYNLYWLSGGADVLDAAASRELAEAVNSGDGLVVDGSHGVANRWLDPLLGMRYLGAQPASPPPTVTLDGSFLPQGSFVVNGVAQRGELAGGTAQAHFADASPAVVTSSFGAGRTLTYAFDLMATLKAQPASTLLRDVLVDGMAFGAARVPPSWGGSAYVPMSTLIENRGEAADIDVTVTVPAGMGFISASPAAASQSTTALTWQFSLAANAHQVLDLGLRAPATSGRYVVRTQISARSAGANLPSISESLEVVVVAADVLLPQTIASVQSLAVTQPAEVQARGNTAGYLQAASADLLRGDANSAMQNYFRAIDELAAITSVPIADLRSAIDRLIQEAGRPK